MAAPALTDGTQILLSARTPAEPRWPAADARRKPRRRHLDKTRFFTHACQPRLHKTWSLLISPVVFCSAVSARLRSAAFASPESGG